MSGYTGTPFPPAATGQESSYFYRERQLAHSDRTPTTELSVEAIGSVNNLAAAFDMMRRENGQAPGPDGVRYADLGRRELFEVLRPVSKSIKEGTYRPGPAREVKIPKSGGRGFRTLTLRNLFDRVVAKAFNAALTPFWEEFFLDGSHGFRPNRSNLTLLADLQRMMAEQDRWTLVSDDIKNAFPSVNVDLVMDDHRRHLGNNPLLLQLIDAVLHGDDVNKKVGIDQGCPYTPTALNVHLHQVFDVHAQAHASGANPGILTPWFRYADNIVVACRDVAEGEQTLFQTSQRLRAAGLALKGENSGKPVDLRRGGQVQLLGFVLFKQGNQLRYKLNPDAWEELKKNLLGAHTSDSPSTTALSVLQGWLDAHGPAFRKRQDRTVSHMLRLARDLGFRELHGHDHYEQLCERAWQKWLSLTRQARTSL